MKSWLEMVFNLVITFNGSLKILWRLKVGIGGFISVFENRALFN